MGLTRRQIFLALAKEVPAKNGALGANPSKSWKDVDAKFPDSSETGPGGLCATAEAMVLRDLSRILQPHRRD